MNKYKLFSIALFATAALQAQDLDQAKKAIDAEQYDKAKSILKSTIQSKPSNGKAAFLLGNIYLMQNVPDSAKIFFDKGLAASEDAKFNYIGLGQMELDKGNTAAAQTNFAQATKDIRKKDTEELVYVARAYMNSDKPDYKGAIAVLTKAQVGSPGTELEFAL